jgi:hypothetical protein
MPDQALFRLLEDRRVLLEAHAASSAYVLRRGLEGTAALRAFRRRLDLAPLLLQRIEQLSTGPGDPVALAAHVYALELTGGQRELTTSLIGVLKTPRWREDTIVGVFAGHVANGLLRDRRKLTPDAHLLPSDLDKIREALERQRG